MDEGGRPLGGGLNTGHRHKHSRKILKLLWANVFPQEENPSVNDVLMYTTHRKYFRPKFLLYFHMLFDHEF